jgi:signal transduction histidine kinase
VHGGQNLLIEIIDTGTGIAAADLPRVMETFFTTKPPGKGTGLGLPICRRIVEAHGGRICIESEPGKGTTVRIVLPVDREEER